MTKFKNTIMGRILRGVGKVGAVLAPVALGVVSGGASIGVGAGVRAMVGKNVGIGARVKAWLASRKKKRGGTVLGKVLTDTKNAALGGLGESLGGMTHNIITELEAKRAESGQELGPLGKGFKSGFGSEAVNEFVTKNKNLLLVGAGVLGVGAILLLRNKRRR
jgi:hypothetical protein